MAEFAGQWEHGHIDTSVSRYGPEWHFGLWEPGRYGLLIEDVQAIDPVPCRGMQGLWEWEREGQSMVAPAGGLCREVAR